ncbi:nucleotidyltransferase family protein [Rathayibacter soli]|uniref:2-nitropropane dioxygenase n=1 Tax=Rathayibacter soli TaxID=3144168 RepID=UPI0027E3EFAB|nr:2-nitropropane dioxygenase [Glaciibacter superstes]
MQAPTVEIPLAVRLRLGRAAAQSVADRVGADILHIKGDAVDTALRPVVRSGTDVDILVRPAHVARFDAALRLNGWSVYSTFTYGSPFGHAQTYLHEFWGYLDLHRLFPGIEEDPSAAFDLLWAGRSTTDIAGVDGAVPAVTAQAMILLLNAARTTPPGAVAPLWADADEQLRTDVRQLVAQLHADVAFAAATGDLEHWRSARTYPLWKVITSGGSRAAEWRARVRAAPNFFEAARIVARAPAVNVEHLTHVLGRRPTRTEIVREFFGRPVTALRQAVSGRKTRS